MLSLQAWRRVHSWSSLICTAVLVLACVTGLPLIFHEEIDAARRGGHSAAAAGSGPSLPLDDIVDRGLRHSQGQYVQFVFWDHDAPGLIGLGMASTPNAALDDVHRLMFNGTTGALVQERPPERGVLEFVLKLHSTLLAGRTGETLLGLMALGFVASVVSGVVLYGPTMRRLDFGTIRTGASLRLKWLGLHNLTGIAAAMWMLIVGATGFINTLEGPLFSAWSGDQIDRLLTPYQGKPYPARLSSPQAAVDTAMRALPGMTPTSEGFPYSRFGSPRHYLIWMHGVTPVTTHLFTPVLVDAETGELAAARGLPWYLRVLELSRPLHFGDYGGWPLKVLWAVFDVLTVVIVITGLGSWRWRRARTLAQGRGDGGSPVA